MAQVLDAIYEPHVSVDCSYGFRPGRNTIQALRHVARPIASRGHVDHGGRFGNIASIVFAARVILACLRKRIKDERFLDLVRTHASSRGDGRAGSGCRPTPGRLKAGWCSPILIIWSCTNSTAGWKTTGRPTSARRPSNSTPGQPDYARHKRNLVRWRAQLHGRIPMGRQTPEGLRAKIKHALARESTSHRS